MTVINKLLLGLSSELHLDDSAVAEVLANELAVYPQADSPACVEFYLDTEIFKPRSGLSNPGSHVTSAREVYMDFGNARVLFDATSHYPFRMRFAIPQTSMIRSTIQRWKSMQYSSRIEASGQFFHELVLIPALLLNSASALFHAAGFENRKGRIVLVGGTGGVGKTSLELEMCAKHGFRFLADDLAPVTSSGRAWPNYAYPKIYGYNVSGDASLGGRIKGGNPLSRAHWALHQLRGQDKVRRRLSPLDLYEQRPSLGGELAHYIFLARYDGDAISAMEVPARVMADLNTRVMMTEYGFLMNHVIWHEINCSIMGIAPRFTYARVVEQLRVSCDRALQRCTSHLVKVPRSLDHHEYLRLMPGVLEAITD